MRYITYLLTYLLTYSGPSDVPFGAATVIMSSLFCAIREELRQRKLPRMQSLCDLAQPRKLHWNVSKEVSNEIAQAAQSLDRWSYHTSCIPLVITLSAYCK